MAIVLVRLGEFIFDGFEYPEAINFGGSQIMSRQTLVGGKRVINTMGRSDDDISWSGYFDGLGALDRARFIDQYRIDGKPLDFTYDRFKYKVLIKDFKPVYKTFYWIPYSITLEVIEDLTLPQTFLFPATFADLILDAIAQALEIGELIGDGGLLSELAALSGIINGVPGLNNATTSELNAILSGIAGAQSAITNLLASL